MRRYFCCAILVLSFGAGLLEAQSVQRLQDVRTIYVAPLGGPNPEAANLIREKLISYLTKHRVVSVVEDQDNADAILIGSGLIENTATTNGRASYHVQAAVHLVNKEGKVLWADDVSNSLFVRSATSSFAENVARKLAQAMSGEGDRK